MLSKKILLFILSFVGIGIIILILLMEGNTDTKLVLTLFVVLVPLSVNYWYHYRVYKNAYRYLTGGYLLSDVNDTNDVPKEVIRVVDEFKAHIVQHNDIELKKKRIELSALQDQINPHFLYNTLESIRGQALKNKQIEIAEMTERLARYYRYSISSRGEFVRIEDELDNIRDYFAIQRFRFERPLKLNVCCEHDTILSYYIPKMTLQPIIENAVFHGLEKQKEGGRVEVKLYVTEKKLYVIVSDNGVGMDFEKVNEINRQIRSYPSLPVEKRIGGIALINLQGRIQLLYGNEFGIRITSSPGKGTDVEIVFPIIRSEDIDYHFQEDL